MAIEHALADGVIHTTLIGRVTIDDVLSYYAANRASRAGTVRLYRPRLVSTTIAPPAALRPYSGSAASLSRM